MNANEIAPGLPAPARLRELCRRTALVEKLIAPRSDFREHDHVIEWRPGWDLVTRVNGGGDEYFIALSDEAGLLRCFDHESEASPYANDGEYPPGTVDSVPERFRTFLSDPTFTNGDESAVTALLWFLPGETTWRTGAPRDVNDGAGWLLRSLMAEDPAREYHGRFEDHYELELDLSAVRAVFAGAPLTEELVAALNPEADPAELLREAIALLGPGRT